MASPKRSIHATELPFRLQIAHIDRKSPPYEMVTKSVFFPERCGFAPGAQPRRASRGAPQL